MSKEEWKRQIVCEGKDKEVKADPSIQHQRESKKNVTIFLYLIK
jgi:hypothetical protein